jgi:hypothetical protein
MLQFIAILVFNMVGLKFLTWQPKQLAVVFCVVSLDTKKQKTLSFKITYI